MNFSKSGIIIGGSIAAVIAIVMFLPVSVPYTISAPGKILAAREWIVSQSADGRIVTRLVDRAKGVTNDYTVSQFERGDAIEFKLSNAIAAGAIVHAGDTIGELQSSDVEQELARMKGELATSVASLALNTSGDKQSVIDEAKHQIVQAERQAEVSQAILERQKSLFERNMVSQQEYELASQEAALAKIAIDIAKARFQSVSTGAKKEQVEFIRSQVQSLQREIEVLERRRTRDKLVSPLNGVAMNVASNDTLLIVSDTSAYVVLIPVRLRERDYLAHDQHIAVKTREMGQLPKSTLAHVDKTIYTLNGEQVVFATAEMSDATTTLMHGLSAQCKVACSDVLLREFVARHVRTLFN